MEQMIENVLKSNPTELFSHCFSCYLSRLGADVIIPSAIKQ